MRSVKGALIVRHPPRALLCSFVLLGLVIAGSAWGCYYHDVYSAHYHWHSFEIANFANGISLRLHTDGHELNAYSTSLDINNSIDEGRSVHSAGATNAAYLHRWAYELAKIEISHSTVSPSVSKFGTGHIYYLFIPTYTLLILAAIPAGAWSLLRRGEMPPGLCEGCGYDLRASAERCPECGRAIATTPSRDASPNGIGKPVPHTVRRWPLGTRLATLLVLLKLSMDAILRLFLEPRHEFLEMPRALALLTSLPSTHPFTERPELNFVRTAAAQAVSNRSAFDSALSGQFVPVVLFLAAMVLNSLFWGYAIAWIWQPAARLFRAKGGSVRRLSPEPL